MIATMTMAAVLGAMAPTPGAACASLPIGGTGQVVGANGPIAIVGNEGHRALRVGDRRPSPLGRDVLNATLRALCPAGTRDYVLVAAELRGSSCPVQYRVVEIVGGAVVRASPGFGTCADAATAAISPAGFVVTMPAGPGSPTNVSYRYAGGKISAVAAPPPVVVALAPAPTTGGHGAPVLATWSTSACAVIAQGGASARSSDVILADFTRTWPQDWRSSSRLRRQPFTPTQLRATVTELACLATLPGGDRVVADLARPLFGSRHGAAAFDQLDEVARGATVDPGVRAAARSFHAHMRFEVDTPRLH